MAQLHDVGSGLAIKYYAEKTAGVPVVSPQIREMVCGNLEGAKDDVSITDFSDRVEDIRDYISEEALLSAIHTVEMTENTHFH